MILQSPRRAGMVIAPTMCAILSLVTPAHAVTHLKRGDAAPVITLTGLDGSTVSPTTQDERPVVLLFGELYHERSVEAAHVLQRLTAEPGITDLSPFCIMIVTQPSPAAELRQLARERRIQMPIVHDADRRASTAYRVSVLPSVIVVDAQRRIVLASAGLFTRSADAFRSAILAAGGRFSPAGLDAALHPTSVPVVSDARSRAERLVILAGQLARSGMPELAQDKYREAMKADPSFAAPRIGLGRLALRRRDWVDAETHFQSVAALDEQAPEAVLGMAAVELARGAAELPKAEQRIRGYLASHPADAEAYFLLGEVCDQSGRFQEAAASYRRAAELFEARCNGQK
jgi:hypothetical protein